MQMQADFFNIEAKIERLRRVRKAVGFSEEECARRIGVAFSTYNRWERGKTLPKSRIVLNAIDHFLKKYESTKFGTH